MANYSKFFANSAKSDLFTWKTKYFVLRELACLSHEGQINKANRTGYMLPSSLQILIEMESQRKRRERISF
jgi:hypothetical protein